MAAPSPNASRPFRRAVLRGLGVVMPPLLTIVLLLWLWGMVESYVLRPLEGAAARAIGWSLHSAPEQPERPGTLDPDRGRPVLEEQGRRFVQLPSRQWVAEELYDLVEERPGEAPLRTARDYEIRAAQLRYLRRPVVLPVFLLVFVLTLYVLGRLMAARFGRLAWSTTESIIEQIPLVRNIYSSVKQVTDFVFNEQSVGFNRVVAVEYPRRGIWTIAFVTGEGMLQVREAAAEPILSLLIPTSPMPATGFTITVLKREAIDLDITIDQALQFVVSCGVVIPAQQHYDEQAWPARLAATVEQGAAGVAEGPANSGE